MNSEQSSPLSSPSSPPSGYFTPQEYSPRKPAPKRIFFPSAPTTPQSSLQKRRNIRPLTINTQSQSKSAPASPRANGALEALAGKLNRAAMDVAIVPRQGSKATVSATFVWMKNGKRTTWRLSKEFFIPQGSDVKECQEGWKKEIQKEGQKLFDEIFEKTKRDLASYKSFDIEPSKEKKAVILRFPSTEAAEEKPIEEITCSEVFDTFFENIQTVSALKEAANTGLFPVKPLPPKPSSSKTNKVLQSPIDNSPEKTPITEPSSPKTPNDETLTPNTFSTPPLEDTTLLDLSKIPSEEMRKKMEDENIHELGAISSESLSSSSSPRFKPLVGIRNTGNTCYLATAFQQIATNPILWKAFLEDQALPLNHTIKQTLLAYASANGNERSIDVEALQESLEFDFHQYEASEALNRLIANMNLNSSSLAIERQETWTYQNENGEIVSVPAPAGKIFPFFTIEPKSSNGFMESITALTRYSGANHEERRHNGRQRRPQTILQTFSKVPKTAIFQIKTQSYSRRNGGSFHRNLFNFPDRFDFPQDAVYGNDPASPAMHLRGFGLHLALGEKPILNRTSSLSTSSIQGNGGHWVSFTREFSKDGQRVRYVCYDDASAQEISKAVFDQYLQRASFLVYNRESEEPWRSVTRATA